MKMHEQLIYQYECEYILLKHWKTYYDYILIAVDVELIMSIVFVVMKHVKFSFYVLWQFIRYFIPIQIFFKHSVYSQNVKSDKTIGIYIYIYIFNFL